MSTVTPIRPQASGQKKSRTRKSRDEGKYMLHEPKEGPACMRLIQALHGVCQATEELAENRNVDLLELGTAAEILSDMLQNRITELP